MTKQLQRFDFGNLRDFRGPIQFVPEMPEVQEEEAPPPPPPPTYGEDELQQARIDAKKMGYQEGFTAGMAQAAAEADSRQQAADTAMQSIASQVATLASTYQGILEKQSLEVSELALLIARKVADAALEERSVDAIAAMVLQCLPVLYSRPRLVVDLNPDTLPVAEARLKTLLATQGYEGELQFRANPALGMADVKLEWGNGMAERSTETLWQEIEALLARVPLTLETAPEPTTGE